MFLKRVGFFYFLAKLKIKNSNPRQNKPSPKTRQIVLFGCPPIIDDHAKPFKIKPIIIIIIETNKSLFFFITSFFYYFN